MQSATVAHQAGFYAYAKAGVDSPSVEDFMPPRYRRLKRPEPTETPKEQFGTLLQMVGGSKEAIRGNND